jgi:hypothetical protein
LYFYLQFLWFMTYFRLSNDLENEEAVDVPTLHVVYTRPEPTFSASLSESAQCRDDLLTWLAEEALGGDVDAAEWMLLACIARVYVLSTHCLHSSD